MTGHDLDRNLLPAYPMSFEQEALWTTHQALGGLPVYTVPWVHRIRGPLCREALVAAFGDVVRRHESLRTTLEFVDGTPRQIVRSAEGACPWRELNLIGRDESAISKAIRETLCEPFDLCRLPLVRPTLLQLGLDDAILSVAIHHACFDSWSGRVLGSELAELYEARVTGREPRLPHLDLQYGVYAARRRERLDVAVVERLQREAAGRLAGAPPETTFPLDRRRPVTPSHRGGTVPLAVRSDTTRRLIAMARQRRATTFALLTAALTTLLYRLTGQSDLVLGAPVSLREDVPEEALIGYFVNMLVLRQQLARGTTFANLIAQTQTVVREAVSQRHLPFSELVQAVAPTRVPGCNPIFQVLLVIEDSFSELRMHGLDIEPLPADTGTSKFDVTVTLVSEGDRLKGSLEYASDVMTAATAGLLVERLSSLLDRLAADPHVDIAEVSALAPSERIVVTHSGPDSTLPADWPLAHELVERQEARTPNADAVLCGQVLYTFSTLVGAADRLARVLWRTNAGRGPVGICLERSELLPIAVLAVLRSGGAYLALDPQYPASRLEFMMRDSGMRVLITRGGTAQSLRVPEGVVVVDPESTAVLPGQAPPGPAVSAPDLAYVIYTSGSTGMPKGVEMPHGPLANLLSWQAARSRAATGWRTLQFASLSFDVAFQELFSTWATGGCIVLVDHESRRSPTRLLQLMNETRVQRAFLPYVALQQLAEHAVDCDDYPGALEEVITAGEQLHITPAIRRFFSRTGATLDNHYGPSETHVVTAEWLSGDPTTWPELPSIGRGISHARVAVLDAAGSPQPLGVAGEICIGGPVMARGYLRRPAMTAERFVPDPAGGEGQRIYRTGDIGKLLHDGCIQYIGRRDGQVKVRGYRIELGEVEAALKGQACVEDAVVVVSADGSGGRRLVAYVVPRSGEQFLPRRVRQSVLRTLPEHMVPSVLIPIDSFPLTPSGKVDRLALEGRALRPAALPATGGTGRDAVELRVADIWEAALKRRCGVDDNFFELGGSSLLAVRMLTAVRAQFGIDLSLASLYQAPTIASMSQLLRDGRSRVADRCLVPLRTAGIGLPLFCFHPLGGTLSRYVDLAMSPAVPQPVFGLQAAGFDLTCEPRDRIEDMAESYLADMRSVQPRGPYHLVGFSLGGVIAYEVAQQLGAVGESVGLLAVIDTGPDEDVDLSERYAVEIITHQFLGLALDVDELLTLPQRDRNERILRAGVDAGRLPPDYNTDRMRRMLQIYEANGRALAQYVVRPYPGQMTLVRASDSDDLRDDLGWSAFCLDVRVHRLPGNHFAMMTPPNLDRVAALLGRRGV